jgi:hypothetical protein
MKLSKKTLRAIHNVFQDCGIDHQDYYEGLVALQQMWGLFDGDEEITIDRSYDLRPKTKDEG